MGKVYKDKKSSGCALCKPHKHGWAPKKKVKVVATEKMMAKDIDKTLAGLDVEMSEEVTGDGEVGI